ncbi:MAG: stage III sporulation protein AC [Oscillospiraceae bacterium]|nr:stage III sporulation protein AC [Clostridiaceae bacterium]MDO4494632.1 stage III sporulation protein AC [Clostridiaceae bacterium]MDY5949146.1 stage III sporulation protein AC [Oscillospiraceae bacterium]
MDITVVIKIAAVGIIVAILNAILVRSGRDDYAMITILAGIVVVLMMLIPQFSALLDTVRAIMDF